MANVPVSSMRNSARPNRDLHTVGLNYTKHLQTGFPNKTHFKLRADVGCYIMKFKNCK